MQHDTPQGSILERPLCNVCINTLLKINKSNTIDNSVRYIIRANDTNLHLFVPDLSVVLNEVNAQISVGSKILEKCF